jgi:hypothetical protein
MTKERLSKEQVEADVREQLDLMFKNLAGRWQLPHGDVDPMATMRWEEQTVPAIIEFCWHLYDGNAPVEPVMGWCHVCGRDISRVEDHAAGCEAGDRGPDHPEVSPYGITAKPEPDGGLPVEFLTVVAQVLNQRRPELDAMVDYPGILTFTAEGLTEGRLYTGYTGLHVHDDDGWSPDLDVDLVALEDRDTITVRNYVDTLLRVIDYSTGVVGQRRNREALAAAVQRFKDAALQLQQAWDAVGDGDALENYPAHWHSFDEEAFELQELEVRPRHRQEPRPA